MSKKLLTIIGLLALGAGTIGSIALQSHAQVMSSNPAKTLVSTATTPAQEENNTKDTDNIQIGTQDGAQNSIKDTDNIQSDVQDGAQDTNGKDGVNEPAETSSIDTTEN
jgi:hypothetical protein